MRRNRTTTTGSLKLPTVLLSLSLPFALSTCLTPAWGARAYVSSHAGPVVQDAQAAPASPCKGVLQQPDVLKKTVLGVTKYQNTYVLVLAGSAKDKVTSATSPDIASLSVEVNDEPNAIAVANDLHITNINKVPATAQSPVQPIVDLGAGKTEAAIVWGPLAGAALNDLGLEDKISIFSVDKPTHPPSLFAGAPEAPNPCASGISDDLDSFGVLPAELLVPVDLRAMLNTPTPVFSMQNAEQGQAVFQQVCAKCHGQYAIQDPALAPVDLLKSIRRFQYIGFEYIVLNGRNQKGMPSWRGTVSDDQIALIYQYLVARSKHELAAGTSAPVAGK